MSLLMVCRKKNQYPWRESYEAQKCNVWGKKSWIFNVKPGGKYINTTVSRPNNMEMYSYLGPRWSWVVLLYSPVRSSCKRQLEILGKYQGQSGNSSSEENSPTENRLLTVHFASCKLWQLISVLVAKIRKIYFNLCTEHFLLFCKITNKSTITINL